MIPKRGLTSSNSSRTRGRRRGNVASLESVRPVAAINPAGVSALRPPIKTESVDLTEDLRSIPSRLARRSGALLSYDRSNARPDDKNRHSRGELKRANVYERRGRLLPA